MNQRTVSAMVLCTLLSVRVLQAEGRDPAAPNSLEMAGRQIAKIAAEVTPAVVHIESERTSRGGTDTETGSGVIVRSSRSPETFVVTNRHVVADANTSQIKIRLADGRTVRPKRKIEDKATDLSVLVIDGPDVTVAHWGDSDSLEIGNFVLAAGSPFGLSRSITLGIISAKGRRALDLGDKKDVINQDFLQTDAAINPGNSGGPLLDMQGHIVGINTAIASSGGGNEGIGFSIPSNLVKMVAEELLEHGRVQRGYLGVRLDDHFDEAAARRFGLDRKRGARVVEIYPETPASSADLREDDLILSFDGMEIEDENHLIHLVSLTQINKSVRVAVIRSGKQVTVNVTLSERPLKSQSAIEQDSHAPKKRRADRSGLGVRTLTDGLAIQAGHRAGLQGLLVLKTPPGCDPADDDSLHLYDVIVEVSRTPVKSIEDFLAATEGPAVDSTEQSNQKPASPQTFVLKVIRREGGRTVEQLVTWER